MDKASAESFDGAVSTLASTKIVLDAALAARYNGASWSTVLDLVKTASGSIEEFMEENELVVEIA